MMRNPAIIALALFSIIAPQICRMKRYSKHPESGNGCKAVIGLCVCITGENKEVQEKIVVRVAFRTDLAAAFSKGT